MEKLICLICDWILIFTLAFCILMDDGDIFFFITVIFIIIIQIIVVCNESKKEKLIRKREVDISENTK